MVALAIFALTYLAISAGRLPGLSVDRPAAALLGAVLMVASGVLTPAEGGAAVNGETIGLLLGTMILSAYLGEAGFFRWASWRVIQAAGTARSLLWGLTVTAGVLSALLVNDTVCLMMTPLAARIAADAKLPLLPFLLAIAFGANAGSVATLTGNPQNMIVGSLSGIGYGPFARALALPALASLLVVAALLQRLFRDRLPAGPLAILADRPPLDGRLLWRALAATGLALVGFLAGFELAWTALFAAALLMAVAGRAPRAALARVDWPLLVFFAGLFVVVAGVGKAGIADALYRAAAPWLGETALRQAVTFGLFGAAVSQVVSNVPFVILAGHWVPRLADPKLLWLSTALCATLAGNLTVVGSVANVIVLELAGPEGHIGFWRFLRYGAVVTVATLAVGLGILLLEYAGGWI